MAHISTKNAQRKHEKKIFLALPFNSFAYDVYKCPASIQKLKGQFTFTCNSLLQ